MLPEQVFDLLSSLINVSVVEPYSLKVTFETLKGLQFRQKQLLSDEGGELPYVADWLPRRNR